MDFKPIICKERPYQHEFTPSCFLCIDSNADILELQKDEESLPYAWICKECWYGIRLASGITPVIAGA